MFALIQTGLILECNPEISFKRLQTFSVVLIINLLLCLFYVGEEKERIKIKWAEHVPVVWFPLINFGLVEKFLIILGDWIFACRPQYQMLPLLLTLGIFLI